MRGALQLFDDFLSRIDGYHERRDFPALKGPSYLSVHLRFGTIAIRALAREAHARMLHGSKGAEVWLNELVWRGFLPMNLPLHQHAAWAGYHTATREEKYDNRAHPRSGWRGRAGRTSASRPAHATDNNHRPN